MCINLETSIISYTVGTITGWTLYKKGDKSNQVIGITIIFITLVQLIEALMYLYGEKYHRYLSIILAISLGLQGFVFSQSYKSIFGTTQMSYYITAIISIIITIMAVSPSFNTGTFNKKLTWDFMDNEPIRRLYFAMYAIIAISSIGNQKFMTFGTFIVATNIFSYWFAATNNRPSMWCMTSAITTPLYLLLELQNNSIVF